MAIQVLFIQGAGANVHDEWDQKLADSLARELGPGFRVRYPRMPQEADPKYAAWKAVLLEELDALQDGAVLVGHSVGATVLLHTLADQRPKFHPGGLFLIAAPFIGEGGWPSEDIQPRADFGKRLPIGMPVVLYHGCDDETVPVDHVELYARTLPQAAVRMSVARDHQMNNDLGGVAREIQHLVAN